MWGKRRRFVSSFVGLLCLYRATPTERSEVRSRYARAESDTCLVLFSSSPHTLEWLPFLKGSEGVGRLCNPKTQTIYRCDIKALVYFFFGVCPLFPFYLTHRATQCNQAWMNMDGWVRHVHFLVDSFYIIIYIHEQSWWKLSHTDSVQIVMDVISKRYSPKNENSVRTKSPSTHSKPYWVCSVEHKRCFEDLLPLTFSYYGYQWILPIFFKTSFVFNKKTKCFELLRGD